MLHCTTVQNLLLLFSKKHEDKLEC